MVRRSITDRDIKAILALEEARGREANQEDALSSVVIGTLRGSVWHTTNRDRYRAILETGSILPDPPISDSERWGTAPGTKGCPYVRSLGGVSLFDFSDFDAEAYSKDYPVSSWREFVPYRSTWGEAIWIEIDVAQIVSGFVSGSALLARWKAEQATNRFMPRIEAAHIGSLPQRAFRRVLVASKASSLFLPFLW